MLRPAWSHQRLNARSTVPSRASRSGGTSAGLPDRERDIVTELATFGPFFTVHAHLPGERPELPWRTVDELASRSEPLQYRIASVRRALAVTTGIRADQIEARVAASVAHCGVVARLVSPTLAAISLGYGMRGVRVRSDRAGDGKGCRARSYVTSRAVGQRCLRSQHRSPADRRESANGDGWRTATGLGSLQHSAAAIRATPARSGFPPLQLLPLLPARNRTGQEHMR